LKNRLYILVGQAILSPANLVGPAVRPPSPMHHNITFRRCAAKGLTGIEVFAVKYFDAGGQNGNPGLDEKVVAVGLLIRIVRNVHKEVQSADNSKESMLSHRRHVSLRLGGIGSDRSGYQRRKDDD
jgi:hypothetical protein